jgi:hypothetical protein
MKFYKTSPGMDKHWTKALESAGQASLIQSDKSFATIVRYYKKYYASYYGENK